MQISGVAFGIVIIIVSAVLNASFALPMKLSRKWEWENSWLIFSLFSLLALPFAVVQATVGSLPAVYRDVPFSALLPALICGFVWGTAQVAFGIGISLVGMAMAFAIVGGLAGTFGSLLPLVFLHPRDLLEARGYLLLLSIGILAAGLRSYVSAARERDAAIGSGTDPSGSPAFRKGLAVCIYTGLAGSALNFGFALSGSLTYHIVHEGTSPEKASLCVWAVLLASATIPNVLYSLYLLIKRDTLRLFSSGFPNYVWALVMAVLWLSGTLGYGVGATVAGKFGNSIGYAIYMAVLLLWSTLLGLITGEWRRSSPNTKRTMGFAVGLFVISVCVLGCSALLA